MIEIGHYGLDNMIVGCTSAYTISDCHCFICEFISAHDRVYSVQPYVEQLISDLP